MGRRVFAVLVDGVLIFLLASVFYAGAVMGRYNETSPPSGTSVDEACGVLSESYASCVTIGRAVYVSTSSSLSFAPFATVAGFLVLVLLQGLTGATVGKFLVGLRVVDRNGRPPGVLRALLRTVFLLVDALPWVVPLLGWLVALTNTRHRRLGDLAAGTMVVRRRTLAYIRR
jgi:uncharacterized RDD family membrane protein YckC